MLNYPTLQELRTSAHSSEENMGTLAHSSLVQDLREKGGREGGRVANKSKGRDKMQSKNQTVWMRESDCVD